AGADRDRRGAARNQRAVRRRDCDRLSQGAAAPATHCCRLDDRHGARADPPLLRFFLLPPPYGEGWGGGWCDGAPWCHTAPPPPLTPPHKGEGKRYQVGHAALAQAHEIVGHVHVPERVRLPPGEAERLQAAARFIH